VHNGLNLGKGKWIRKNYNYFPTIQTSLTFMSLYIMVALRGKMRYARRFIVGIVIFGIFYLVFHYIFAAAKTYINLLLAGFFTIVLLKLWQWRREKQEFKKVGVKVSKEEKKELYEKLDKDYLLDPAFAEDPANVYHGVPQFDRTADYWKDDK